MRRQSTPRPDLFDQKIQHVSRWVIVRRRVSRRWYVMTLVRCPQTFVTLPLPFGYLIAPTLSRALVMFIWVLPSLDAHNACPLFLVFVDLVVFLIGRRRFFAHCGPHLPGALRR